MRVTTYINSFGDGVMSEVLKQHLRLKSFDTPYQEAVLGLLVAADRINRKIEAACERYGITAAQYNVLRILRGVHPDGHPRFEIIDRMIQAAPDVTRLIDRLEKSGLVQRSRSTEDKRHSLTFITDRGLDLLRVLQPKIGSLEHQLSKEITEEDAKSIATLCDRIAETLTLR